MVCASEGFLHDRQRHGKPTQSSSRALFAADGELPWFRRGLAMKNQAGVALRLGYGVQSVRQTKCPRTSCRSLYSGLAKKSNRDSRVDSPLSVVGKRDRHHRAAFLRMVSAILSWQDGERIDLRRWSCPERSPSRQAQASNDARFMAGECSAEPHLCNTGDNLCCVPRW